MKRQKHSFHYTLLVSLLAVALVPLLFGIIVILSTQKKIIFQTLEEDLMKRTSSVSLLVQDTISSCTMMVQSLSANNVVTEYFSEEQEADVSLNSKVYAILYACKQQSPSIEISLSGIDGRMLSTTEPNPEYNLVNSRHWGILRKALLEKKPVLYCHDWKYSYQSGRVISIGISHLDKNGIPDGVIIVDLTAPLLERYQDVDQGAFSLAILDSLGVFCYKSPSWKSSETDGQRIETELPSGNGIMVKTRRSMNMMEVILADTRGIFLVLFFFSIVFAIAVSIAITRRFSQPISRLAICVKRISDGDLMAKSNIQSGIIEFDSLGKDIDQTGEKIEKLILQNNEKEKSLRHSMIKSLESEVHPHFIFNCLGIIQQSIKLNDRNVAIDMTNQLARLLRSGLNEMNVIPLRSEIETSKSYLAIQSYRFGKRLEYSFEFEDWILDSCSIPKMSVQTLVENAIVHNIDKIDHVLIINVKGFFYKNALTILISDNGIGIPQSVIDDLEKNETGKVGNLDNPHGHGLPNTDRRLKLFYGEKCGLQIINSPENGVSIKMVLMQEALCE